MTEYIEDVERVARAKFLTGLLDGKPLADAVCEAVALSFDYGGRRALTQDHFPASTAADSIADLQANALEYVIDQLFGDGSLKTALHMVVISGAAFGFAEAKQEYPA